MICSVGKRPLPTPKTWKSAFTKDLERDGIFTSIQVSILNKGDRSPRSSLTYKYLKRIFFKLKQLSGRQKILSYSAMEEAQKVISKKFDTWKRRK